MTPSKGYNSSQQRIIQESVGYKRKGTEMADFGVFVGFGFPARGREEGAVKVFQEFMQFLVGQMQQGNIESFEPVLLQPHGGDLGGCVLVRGDKNNLGIMVASQEFQRLMTRGQAIVEHFGVVNCILGQELDRQMGAFLQETSNLR